MPHLRSVSLIFLVGMLFAGCVSTAEDGAGVDVATAVQSANNPPPSEPQTPEPELVLGDTPLADPDTLLGLEPREIQALLGPVSLKRWEGDGQVMQFSNDQCVMDVYFYESAPGGAFQVSYLSARTIHGTDVDTAPCLTSLLPN